MDNNPHKRRPAGHSTSSPLAKRPKPVTTYNAFTEDQHAVIDNTAAFFHIHPSDLAAAIGSLQNSTQPSHTSFLEPPWPMHYQPLETSTSIAQKEYGFQSLATGNERESSSGSSGQSAQDRPFGFSSAPTTWSNCFPNLPSTNGTATGLPLTSTCYNQTSNVYQHTSFQDQGSDLYSTGHSHLAIRDQPQPSLSSSTYAGQNFEPRYAEPSHEATCNGFLVDDTQFDLASMWQSNPISLSQTPAPQPEIIYSPRNSVTYGSSATYQDPSPHIGKTRYDDPTQNTENTSPSSTKNDSGYPSIDFSDEEMVRTKRGPFTNLVKRAETGQTRKDNACVRCKMQRTRCSPDPNNPRGVCLTCKRVSDTKIVKLPCLRYKIPDTRLFRVGYVPGHVWSMRWQTMEMDDVTTWADSVIRKIQITQNYSANPLVLRVRRFVPLEDDMLTRSWAYGSQKMMAELPPYAIVNLKEAERAYKEYIEREGTGFFFTALEQKDKLVCETYSMATIASKNHMSEQERNLLNLVLRLWIAVRMICKSETICGEEKLGIPPDLLDRSSLMHGRVPITPVMGAQIDVILIQKILTPLRTMVLDQLQKLVLTHKPQNWFCIYLCSFILLHNATLVTKQDIAYARKHGLKTRFAMVEIVKELHLGANILLAYFHYCCKGCLPFSENWEAKETSSMAELDADQVKFIKRTALHVKANEARFREIRDQCICEDEHFYIAQLYEKDWAPRSMRE